MESSIANSPTVTATNPPSIPQQPLTQEEENERIEFLNRLFAFMAERGTSISYIPIFDHRELDLWRLYKSVTARGGLASVVESKLWRQITCELGVDQDRTDAGFRLRMHYLKYLYPFERKFFLCMPDTPNLSPQTSFSQQQINLQQQQHTQNQIQQQPQSIQIVGGNISPIILPSPTILATPTMILSPRSCDILATEAAAAAGFSLLSNTTASPTTSTATEADSVMKKMNIITTSSNSSNGIQKPKGNSCIDLRKLDEASLMRYGRIYKINGLVASKAKEELVSMAYEHFINQDVDESSAIAMFFNALRIQQSKKK